MDARRDTKYSDLMRDWQRYRRRFVYHVEDKRWPNAGHIAGDLGEQSRGVST